MPTQRTGRGPARRLRTAELEAALRILGVDEHHWLDYPDGGCAEVDAEEAAARLVARPRRGTPGHGGHLRPRRVHRPPRPPGGEPVDRPRRRAGTRAAAAAARGRPGGGRRPRARRGVRRVRAGPAAGVRRRRAGPAAGARREPCWTARSTRCCGRSRRPAGWSRRSAWSGSGPGSPARASPTPEPGDGGPALGHSAVVDRTDLALLRGRARSAGAARARPRSTCPAPGDAPCWRCSRWRATAGVSTERLVDSLWPDDPPDNAVQALYSHVSRLRRHLGPLADRLERQANGYRLRLEPFELDADAARRLAAADPQAALGAVAGAGAGGVPVVARAGGRLGRAGRAAAAARRRRCSRRGWRAGTATWPWTRPRPRPRRRCVSARRCCTCVRWRPTVARRRRWPPPRRSGAGWSTRPGSTRRPALAELEQQVAAGSRRSAPSVVRAGRQAGRPDGRPPARPRGGRAAARRATPSSRSPGPAASARPGWRSTSRPTCPRREAVVVPLAVGRPRRPGLPGGRLDAGPAHHRRGPARRRRRSAGRPRAAAGPRQLRARRRRVPRAGGRRPPRARRGVRVLATSRVTLQVPGEYVVRLQPLPGAAGRSGPGRAAAAAGRARVRRARPPAAARTTSWRPRTQPTWSRCCAGWTACRSGIELAARQVAVMPLRDGARAARPRPRPRHRAGGPSRTSGSGRCGRPSTRRTACSTTTSSGCSARSRRSPAGWTWRRSRRSPSTSGDPLDLLHRLVDSSLLVADAESGRYRLLFTVRAFLLDEIVAAGRDRGGARAVRRALPSSIAEEIGERMFGPDEAATDRRLRAELDNLRAARDLAHGRRPGGDHAGGEPGRHVARPARDLGLGGRARRGPGTRRTPGAGDRSSPARRRRHRLVGDFDAAERLADEAIAAGRPRRPVRCAAAGRGASSASSRTSAATSRPPATPGCAPPRASGRDDERVRRLRGPRRGVRR